MRRDNVKLWRYRKTSGQQRHRPLYGALNKKKRERQGSKILKWNLRHEIHDKVHGRAQREYAGKIVLRKWLYNPFMQV